MDLDFKVPSAVPQDLLLIQDLLGTPLTVATQHDLDSVEFSDDSIASTNSEVESEVEVEAGLAPHDEDSGMSAATSDSESSSDSELETNSFSDSEAGHVTEAPQRQRHVHSIEDEESSSATYLQTKNEIIDTDIVVPVISEVEPGDILEKVGEIIGIIGSTVIVKGLPVSQGGSPQRALDAESLLAFEDRKVLGYIYETFGPTSQPLYQVKFNERYPLDISKVWLSREVFHVPQRSHFVFVDQLRKLRGSDASNIHDEEPAEDEIEFSDDEKEAAFKAQRKRRRGHSVSSSRQPTPASFRTHIDDMARDTYHGSNPYDAHGPYDDDYHVTGSSRPPPIPYDDPYTDTPTLSDPVHHMETNSEPVGVPKCESSGDGPKTPRERVTSQGIRRKGDRNHQLWTSSRRGYRQNHTASQRTFSLDTGQSFPAVDERATGYGQVGDAIMRDSLVHSAPKTWFSPEASSVPNYQQQFIQPHINPRFASAFGFNLPPGSMISWDSQNAHDHASRSRPHFSMWTVHGSARSEGEEDTYRPM